MQTRNIVIFSKPYEILSMKKHTFPVSAVSDHCLFRFDFKFNVNVQTSGVVFNSQQSNIFDLLFGNFIDREFYVLLLYACFYGIWRRNFAFNVDLRYCCR
jgi:hypothetical protein